MLCISALCEEMFWDTTVKLAENMSLECIYSSLDTLTQMEWLKINTTNRELIAIFSPTYGLSVKPPYTDRVYFLNSTMAPNDMTLSFHNVSEADVGFYSCFLHTFPHGHWEKVIQVVASGEWTFYLPFYPPTTFDSKAPAETTKCFIMCLWYSLISLLDFMILLS